MDMSELWVTLSSYPTSVYTVILGVLLVFWVFAVLGAIDIDLFSFDLDVDIDADVDLPGFIGLMHTLGFAGVPLTIVLSILIFLAWVFTYIIAVNVLPLVPTAVLKILVGTVTLVGSFLLAIPITSKLVSPLRKLAVINHAKSNKDYVGFACKVTSLEVDDDFGQGFIETGGAGLNVRIRAQVPNEMTKGVSVRIIDYNENNNTYKVISEEDFKENLK
jgi:hypothetical protein